MVSKNMIFFSIRFFIIFSFFENSLQITEVDFSNQKIIKLKVDTTVEGMTEVASTHKELIRVETNTEMMVDQEKPEIIFH